MKAGVKKNLVGLILALAACFAVASLGGIWTSQGLRNWYPALAKPPWTPPNWVFGPVWTLLYVAMAVASWLVWKRGIASDVKMPLRLYGFQLLLNLAWTAIFFGLRQPGWAFGEIVLLWLSILATIVTFWPVSRVASGLLVPYVLWVSFASALNFAIWRLNA